MPNIRDVVKILKVVISEDQRRVSSIDWGNLFAREDGTVWLRKSPISIEASYCVQLLGIFPEAISNDKLVFPVETIDAENCTLIMNEELAALEHVLRDLQGIPSSVEFKSLFLEKVSSQHQGTIDVLKTWLDLMSKMLSGVIDAIKSREKKV